MVRLDDLRGLFQPMIVWFDSWFCLKGISLLPWISWENFLEFSVWLCFCYCFFFLFGWLVLIEHLWITSPDLVLLCSVSFYLRCHLCDGGLKISRVSFFFFLFSYFGDVWLVRNILPVHFWKTIVMMVSNKNRLIFQNKAIRKEPTRLPRLVAGLIIWKGLITAVTQTESWM